MQNILSQISGVLSAVVADKPLLALVATGVAELAASLLGVHLSTAEAAGILVAAVGLVKGVASQSKPVPTPPTK